MFYEEKKMNKSLFTLNKTHHFNFFTTSELHPPTLTLQEKDSVKFD